jgi:GntR family transcriptional regulator
VRTVYDRDGRGVEHLYALYRPDRYSFEFDLVRSGGARKRSWFASPLAARKAAAKSKSSTNIRFI